MIIHYRKDLESDDKIIRNVLYIQVIDGYLMATALLENGRELKIRIDRIEAIFDEKLLGEVK